MDWVATFTGIRSWPMHRLKTKEFIYQHEFSKRLSISLLKLSMRSRISICQKHCFQKTGLSAMLAGILVIPMQCRTLSLKNRVTNRCPLLSVFKPVLALRVSSSLLKAVLMALSGFSNNDKPRSKIRSSKNPKLTVAG